MPSNVVCCHCFHHTVKMECPVCGHKICSSCKPVARNGRYSDKRRYVVCFYSSIEPINGLLDDRIITGKLAAQKLAEEYSRIVTASIHGEKCIIHYYGTYVELTMKGTHQGKEKLQQVRKPQPCTSTNSNSPEKEY